MKKVLPILMAVMLLIGCVGCGSNDSKTETSTNTSESSKNDSASNQSEESKTKEYKVGDVIDFEGEQITVTNVKRKFNTGNQFSVPKSGNEFVKISVTIKNNSNNNISLNPFEFKIQDSAGTIESIVSSTYSLDDQFDSAELIPGGTKSGSIVFEVPKDDTGLKLIYEPSFWADQKLEINL